MQRFARAVQDVVAQLAHTRGELESAGSAEEASIFEAHRELASDPELESGVEEKLRDRRSPKAAVLEVGEEYADMFAAMDDEYLAARTDNVRDVVAQICAEITAELTGSRFLLCGNKRPGAVYAGRRPGQLEAKRYARSRASGGVASYRDGL